MSENHPAPHGELLGLIEMLIDGSIDDAGFDRLQSVLLEDAGARTLYRRYMNLHASLPAMIGNAPRVSIRLSDEPGDSVDVGSERGLLDEGVLDTLMQIDASADDSGAINVTELLAEERRQAEREAEHVTKQDIAAVAGYVARRVVRSRFAISGAVAAAVLIAVAVFVRLGGDGGDDARLADEPVPVEKSAKPVATLTAQHHARWAGGDRVVGDPFYPGQTLKLSGGFAQITTRRGAVAILEAPCTIRMINDDNAIRLVNGRLSGHVETDHAKGFIVRTPTMDVNDLGTVFGVSFDGGSGVATTHVFEGRVRLERLGGGDAGAESVTFEFSAGDAVAVDKKGSVRSIGLDADAFITADKLTQLIETEQEPAYRRWRDATERLRRDPAMIAYYLFDRADSGGGRLINQADSTRGTMDGVFGQPGRPYSKPAVSTGRWGHNGALSFESSEFDIVRVPAEDARAVDGLEALTIGLWVKPDNMDTASHHLVTKRHWDNCVLNLALAWDAPNVTSNSILFHSDMGGLQFPQHTTAANTLARKPGWVHIVVTFDRGERRYYINGRQVGAKPRVASGKTPTMDIELCIGSVQAGIPDSTTYLDGTLDELFILGRAMTGDEIKQLYDTGVSD